MELKHHSSKWIIYGLLWLVFTFRGVVGNDSRRLETTVRKRVSQSSTGKPPEHSTSKEKDSRPISAPPPIGKSSLLFHTTLVVISDVGSEDALRAAQCTYMSTLDPYQIIFISDFSIPRPGGCNMPIMHSLRIPFATDYFDALRELYLSKIPLHPWVLIGIFLMF
jgi:hypothetical protein